MGALRDSLQPRTLSRCNGRGPVTAIAVTSVRLAVLHLPRIDGTSFPDTAPGDPVSQLGTEPGSVVCGSGMCGGS